MTSVALRRWCAVHSWSALICTLFLLIICLTGLPLIFHEDIEGLLDGAPPTTQVAATAPQVSFDTMVARARQRYPDQVVVSVFMDDDEPHVIVGMATSWTLFNRDFRRAHFLKFDVHTGTLLQDTAISDQAPNGILPFVLRLHRDLFAGLGGELFLGLMALFFVVAIVSGVVLYGPFMRRLPFGSVRTERAARLHWLDLHNLVGIVLAVWMSVVGLTGALNELSTPLFAFWQRTTAQALLAPWHGRPVPAVSELSSLDAVFHATQDAVPGMHMMSAVFPGSRFGAPSHYLVWTKGKTPLTSRLFTPVLVDARTGKVTSVVPMPWYLRALEVSRPLHFGDYGGTPLKIIWVVFDCGTIAVLITGLVLWVGKRRSGAFERSNTTPLNR